MAAGVKACRVMLYRAALIFSSVDPRTPMEILFVSLRSHWHRVGIMGVMSPTFGPKNEHQNFHFKPKDKTKRGKRFAMPRGVRKRLDNFFVEALCSRKGYQSLTVPPPLLVTFQRPCLSRLFRGRICTVPMCSRAVHI